VHADRQREAADLLLAAYASGRPMPPVVETFGEARIEDAYQIQRFTVLEWQRRGLVIKGHKVGLASRAMQRQVGVNQPDYGHLMSDMFHLEHLPIPAGTFIQPRIEPEVAFVLGRPLRGPGVTVADVVRAVDFVLPSLEIVDSRIADWKISIVDTIADNASSGGVILGSRSAGVHDLDLRMMGCTLHVNGELVQTGGGGAVLGSPLNSVAWLANTVGPLGVTLEPGHVILPGSMTRAVGVRPGDTVVATMSGLGTVTAVFDGATSEATQGAPR
jgi:2-keto-4-pentenoate hydratase